VAGGWRWLRRWRCSRIFTHAGAQQSGCTVTTGGARVRRRLGAGSCAREAGQLGGGAPLASAARPKARPAAHRAAWCRAQGRARPRTAGWAPLAQLAAPLGVSAAGPGGGAAGHGGEGGRVGAQVGVTGAGRPRRVAMAGRGLRTPGPVGRPPAQRHVSARRARGGRRTDAERQHAVRNLLEHEKNEHHHGRGPLAGGNQGESNWPRRGALGACRAAAPIAPGRRARAPGRRARARRGGDARSCATGTRAKGCLRRDGAPPRVCERTTCSSA